MRKVDFSDFAVFIAVAEEGSSLDFIGMHYDFQAHTIGMSDKNRAKIVDMSFASNMLMSELETNTARLMYASSVMSVPLL